MLLRRGYLITVPPAQALLYIRGTEISIVSITGSMTNAEVNKAKATLKLHRRSPSSLLVLRADQEQLIKK